MNAMTGIMWMEMVEVLPVQLSQVGVAFLDHQHIVLKLLDHGFLKQ